MSVEAPVAPAAPAAAAPSAPAAPAAAAPSAPAPAAPPAAPAAVPDAPAPDQSLTDFFTEALAEAGKETAEPAAPAAAEPAAPAAPAAAEPAPAAAPKEGEEAKPAPAAAEPAAPAVQLDMGETIAPSKLAEEISKAPQAVQDWLNDPNNPLKDSLFAMARRDERSREVMSIIPNKKTAEELVATHGKYHDFDEGFDAIETPEQADQFWSKMWNDFATKGADGKLVAHPAFARIERAIYQSNNDFLLKVAKDQGKVHPILGNTFNQMLDVYHARAEREQDADLQSAVELLRDANSASSQPQSEPTPDQKRRDAALKAREDAANRQDSERRVAKATEYLDAANQTAAQSSVDQAGAIFDKANFSELEEQTAYRELGQRLGKELEKSPLYKREFNRLKAALEKNPSEENQKALQEHVITYQNMHLGRIVAEVARDVTAGRINRAGEKDVKTAAQLERSKTEPAGAAGGASAPQPMTDKEEEAAIRAQWEKTDKRVDWTTYYFNEVLKRQKDTA
jgi:hypothetical protein